jgi:3-methyl-2-oxobutanoate hydroxymethyltransferase
MLGIYSGKKARFMKNFLTGVGSIEEAVQNYIRAVKAGEFPGAEHTF